MAYHFTSDNHFDHTNIIKYSKRPFKNVDEMNEALIVNWNIQVRPGDDVFNLGDFCFGDLDRYKQILGRLNGRILLLRGNHDIKRLGDLDEIPLRDGRKVIVKDYHEIRGAGPDIPMIVLSHYPMLRWNKGHHGSYMLHGHSHGGVNPLNVGTRRLDVGSDCFNYRPVSLEEVHTLLKLQPATGHHENEA